ncbi:alpha/beta hydrolase fold domain-containing protein [Thermomonas flagellata]|uniref:alpha/beta hydrolase fold domain-containing protein n=1 Tax=Thermomonas flagellata TaxID=2888524 RepID=UPI001F04A44D|nr:alpha/beta hydrolase fold domain-containing protein [Thermomonas flagellata]
MKRMLQALGAMPAAGWRWLRAASTAGLLVASSGAVALEPGRVVQVEGGLRSWAAYLPHPERGIPAHAAPLHDAAFAGLPPTLIFSAEYDILHDEAEVYAQRLREAGVAVELEPVAGVNHGFLALEAVLPPADAAMRRLGAWIAQRLA